MENLLEILRKILVENDKSNIDNLIIEFQKFVWLNSDFNDEDPSAHIFDDLADSLDYYEPNSELRRDSPSYYGEEKMRKEIKEALKKIELLKSQEK